MFAVVPFILCASLSFLGTSATLPPTFASKETNFTAAVGALDVKLLCRVDVTKKSKTRYWWTRNGITIRKSGKYRLKKNRFLRIKNVNVLDAGDYVCWAKNKGGEVKRTITLVVFDRRSSNGPQDIKPYFTEKRKMTRDYLLYPEGHRVKLVCSADGFPVPTVVWYKDGKQLKYIPGEQTPLSRHDFEITLQSLKPEDTGLYNCNVSNRAGSIGMTYEVIVQVMMITRPVLPSRVENITAYEGDNVTIKCEVVSDGLPLFQWVVVNPRKNNSIELLQPGLSQEDYVLDADNTRWHGVKLRLTNVTRADERDYFCVVGDNRGYDKQKFRLRVLPKSVQATQKKNSNVTEIGTGKAPVFTHPEEMHQKQTFNSHNPPVLVCKADGNPKPKIKWSKYGKPIKDTSVKISADRLTLTVTSPDVNPSPKYKCVVSNKYGSISFDFQVDFPAPLPPTFASKKTNFTAAVGALDVKLLCRVDVTRKSKSGYWWTRNGVPIRKSRKYRLKKYRYLRIRNVNVSDAGDYVCWAKNKEGEVKRTITLVVFDRRSPNGAQAPLPPTFASKKTNFTAAVGALDVKLLCRVHVTRKSKSGYWWTRNGVPIRKSTKYRLNKYRYLRIRNVNVSDAGDYVCRAKNKEGEVKRTITLVVFDRRSSNGTRDVKPHFTEKTRMTRDYLLYPVGHTVKLVCSADGFPVPTVVWYKNGKQLKYIPGEQTPLSRHDFEITLQSLKPKDTGQYNCNVSNRAGSIGMTYEVIVKEMKITRPVLQSRVENITAYEGDNVTIKCEAVSDGLPHFQWVVLNPRKNNSFEVLRPGLSQEDYVLDAANTRWYGVKLRLTNVTRADERDYVCVVGDNRWYDTQKFRLRVLPKPVQTTQKRKT